MRAWGLALLNGTACLPNSTTLFVLAGSPTAIIVQVQGNSFANIDGGVTISDVSSLSLAANVWANQPAGVRGLDLARISRVTMVGNLASGGGPLVRRLRGIGLVANGSGGNLWGG